MNVPDGVTYNDLISATRDLSEAYAQTSRELDDLYLSQEGTVTERDDSPLWDFLEVQRKALAGNLYHLVEHAHARAYDNDSADAESNARLQFALSQIFQALRKV